MNDNPQCVAVPGLACDGNGCGGLPCALWRRRLEQHAPPGPCGPIVEFDCEGCGEHVVAFGIETIPSHGFCAVCAWLCENIIDPIEMMEIRAIAFVGPAKRPVKKPLDIATQIVIGILDHLQQHQSVGLRETLIALDHADRRRMVAMLIAIVDGLLLPKQED